jgi:hypothetical protein
MARQAACGHLMRRYEKPGRPCPDYLNMRAPSRSPRQARLSRGAPGPQAGPGPERLPPRRCRYPAGPRSRRAVPAPARRRGHGDGGPVLGVRQADAGA